VSRTGRLPILCGAIFLLGIFGVPVHVMAGGPKYVAGVEYFNPAVLGSPIHWQGGAVRYYVDQGPLNGQISNQQAAAMVDAAAALWSAVPTAGVSLKNMGSLNEDVSGTDMVAGNASFGQPADVTPAAVNYPLAIIFDSDGAVINGIMGAGASDPTSCQNNGVMEWFDSINTDATIAHAVIVLNGLCATNENLLEMMSYELERAFGRALDLDYAQVNPGALNNGEAGGTLGWPVMQPLSGVCGATGGICIPNPGQLRFDDVAALNRVYPITAANLGNFPDKLITAANTLSIQGTINFRSGTGMQGVNVVARPLDAKGNPLFQYTVVFVSGSYFNAKHGNPITGWTDTGGNPLAEWGSNDASLQGFFDLSGIPLPPGMTTANYQVTFEALDPLYILTESVGPYTDGSPAPSGTMPVLSLPGLAAGISQKPTVTIGDSATGGSQDATSSEANPRAIPSSGHWCGRLSQVGQTDWFVFPVRAGHTFTVVTQALDERGMATETKALPALGIWDAFYPAGSPSVGWAPGLNGWAAGETWLQVSASADDLVRLGVFDMRGDGRPDYAYNGWVLYADTLKPQRLPLGGGPIVIRGMGFRPSDALSVGGYKAVVTSVSPNEITAIAPPAQAGFAGSVEVEVDDLPIFYASTVITGGISYDAGTGDSLTLNTAPANIVPIGAPLPFTVTAVGANGSPAGGVTVTFTLVSGNASLACGSTSCPVSAAGDGVATMNVSALGTGISIVRASLTNGANLEAHFSGGAPGIVTALTPGLSIAAGNSVNWTTQAIVLNNGTPMVGQSVAWQTASGITTVGGKLALTDSGGVATKSLVVGPLNEGQQAASTACVNGTL
jgi:hypothetical protein